MWFRAEEEDLDEEEVEDVVDDEDVTKEAEEEEKELDEVADDTNIDVEVKDEEAEDVDDEEVKDDEVKDVDDEEVNDVDDEEVKDVDEPVEVEEEEEEQEEKYNLKIRSHHIQLNDKLSLSLDFKTKFVRFVRENEENLFDMSECTVTTETGLCVRADGEILNDGNKTKRSNPRPRLFVLKRPKELSNSEAFEILHEDRVNAFMKRCEDENWSIDTCLSSKAYKSSIGVTELDKKNSSGSRKSTWSSKTFVMTKQVSLSRQEQDNMPLPCVIRSRRLEQRLRTRYRVMQISTAV